MQAARGLKDYEPTFAEQRTTDIYIHIHVISRQGFMVHKPPEPEGGGCFWTIQSTCRPQNLFNPCNRVTSSNSG